MEKIPELSAGPVAAQFEGWRRLFNPFFWIVVSATGKLRLRVRPRGTNGSDIAALSTDYVEVIVRARY